MTNINFFSIRNELKDKFNILNSKLEPEHNYNWVKDLREGSKMIITNDNNANNYNIRDPFNKTVYNSIKNISLGKKKHMNYFMMNLIISIIIWMAYILKGQIY